MTTTPTIAQDGLPELPDEIELSNSYDERAIYGYSAYQMREYALAAVRAAQSAQPERKPLSDAEIETLAHRMATTYTHRTDPTSHAYGFISHTLIDFARAIERLHKIGEPK